MASTKATELAQLSRKLTYNEGTDVAAIDGDGNFLTTGDNTDQLSEGSTNLYYTNTRVDAEIDSYVSGGTGVTVSSGVISIDQAVSTTDSVVFNDVEVTSLTFNASTPDTEVTWNSTYGTLQAALPSFNLQLGQQTVYYAKASVAITKGEVVMFNGVQGDHPLITLADTSASGFIPEWVMGIAAQDLSTNDFGYVVAFGQLVGISTSTYTAGDLLYLDNSTAGALTTTEPSAGDHSILMAAALNSTNNGTILIRPTHKPEIDELHGVSITSKTSGDFLKWDGSNWVNIDPDTDDIDEGSSNLYFTTARIDSHLSGGTGVTYSSGTISIGQDVGTTSDVTFNDLTLSGDLTVNGTTTTISTSELDVTDNVIHMAAGNTGHTTDVGFLGHYEVSSTEYEEGLVKDQSASVWKLITDLPHSAVGSAIDFSSVSYDDLQLNDLTAVDITASGTVTGTFSGNVTGNVTGTVSDISNHDTDDLSEGSTNLYYTDSRVQTYVTQSYINNLNVDADTVDGQHYTDIISEATALAIALG